MSQLIQRDIQGILRNALPSDLAGSRMKQNYPVAVYKPCLGYHCIMPAGALCRPTPVTFVVDRHTTPRIQKLFDQCQHYLQSSTMGH